MIAFGSPLAPRVAVVGAFRSGTNLGHYLVQNSTNARVRYDRVGWKHAPYPVIPESRNRLVRKVNVMTVVKNPFALIRSMHSYHVKADRNILAPTDWAAFLRSPFVITDVREGRSAQQWFATPIDYWNALYWNFTTLPAAFFRAVTVRLEDLVQDAEQQLKQVCQGLSLRQTTAAVLPEAKLDRNKAGRRAATDKTQGFDKAGFEAKTFMNDYSQDDVAYVNARLDPKLMSQLGYDAAGGWT